MTDEQLKRMMLDCLADILVDAAKVATWENEKMTVDTPRLVQALRLHKAWSDSEKTGPDYGGQTRDTHPDGEKIWRIWWDGQLSLCDRATRATDEALAHIDELDALS